MAAVAHLSEAHFIRSFRSTFGETPHRYLQRRRVERSMFLMRETDGSVTDICFDVGHGPIMAPNCVWMAATRPVVAAGMAMRSSSFGEADAPAAP